jgi:hypothetical protein
MVPPTTVSGQAALRELTALSRELKYYADGFKATKKLKGTIQEIEQVKKGVSTATQRTKDLERQVKSSKKILDKTKEVADKAKKITDFLNKGLFKNINPKLGAAVSSFGQLAQAGFTAFLVLKQGEIQGYQLQTDDYNRSGIQDAFTRSINNGIQIKGLQKQIEATNKKLADTTDKTYAEAAGAAKNATKARELANNALYETRQGRKILEGQISTASKKANDALYEIRAGRQKLEAQLSAVQNNVKQSLSNITQGFQQQVNTTIANIQKSLQQSQLDNKKTSEDLVRLKSVIPKLTTVVNNLPLTIERTFNSTQSTIKNIVDRAINPIARTNERWGVSVTPAMITPATVTVADTGGVTITPATVTPVTVRYADFSSSDIGQQTKKIVAGEITNTNNNVSGLSSSVSNLSGAINAVAAEVSNNRKEIEKIKISNISDPRVGDLTGRVKEIEKQQKEQNKVNEEGNKKLGIIDDKLDSIIPTIAGIPIVVGKAADKIITNTPTIPDIEKAAATGVCRSTQPGGCMNKALNDQTGSINNNTNNAANNILQGLDTAGTAGLLAGQQEILNRLGDQLPGGIGGKLERFSKWLHLDRALNLMIWATTIHNALMLSNDIGQTLLGAISNVLQLFGLKDSEGNAFDLGSIISSSIENLIKGIIGADNYTELKEAWQKASRIYQATINIFNQIQGLLSTILNALEITAGRVGKIGNALKKVGEVADSAYAWMNPQPKFNRVTQFLENLQNGASTIQMVTQAPLDIINSVTELTNAGTELTNALKEDNKPENKGTEDKEPDQLKAVQAASKIASLGQEMIDPDLEPDED